MQYALDCLNSDTQTVASARTDCMQSKVNKMKWNNVVKSVDNQTTNVLRWKMKI